MNVLPIQTRQKKLARKASKAYSMYDAALQKYPPIQSRKKRREEWRKLRRVKFASFAPMDPGEGTHRHRSNLWREYWGYASGYAASLNANRKKILLEASGR